MNWKKYFAMKFPVYTFQVLLNVQISPLEVWMNVKKKNEKIDCNLFNFQLFVFILLLF